MTLSNFIAYVSNQFHTSVKNIRTDNGTLFINVNCQKLFSSFGIIHQRSVSYSPQQNVRVERKHQHLLQVARALMFHSKLPIQFWGHAILMATYLINILPTQILDWNTPYSKLYGKNPSYSNLKVFGCLCFATNTIPHKKKFEARATMCCFIGYNFCQKAYKLYDLQEKKIIMSRNMVFYESIFPFKSDKGNSQSEHTVLPNAMDNNFEESFANHQDFIPTNDYNSDETDLINEDENFQ